MVQPQAKMKMRERWKTKIGHMSEITRRTRSIEARSTCLGQEKLRSVHKKDDENNAVELHLNYDLSDKKEDHVETE